MCARNRRFLRVQAGDTERFRIESVLTGVTVDGIIVRVENPGLILKPYLDRIRESDIFSCSMLQRSQRESL